MQRIQELSGQVVTEVSWKVPLSLRTGDGWHLTVETDMIVVRADGDKFLCSADDRAAPKTLAPELSGRIVDQTMIGGQGDLLMEFEDRSQIAVPPDLDAAAWSLSAPTGQRYVCGPGGEVSVEPATRPA
ncbi:hypothetical protein GCM10029992_39350 [Glycomyces albus]